VTEGGQWEGCENDLQNSAGHKNKLELITKKKLVPPRAVLCTYYYVTVHMVMSTAQH
jgi:hypothetical protein